jgi:lipopolysaccharide export system permease protein
VKILYRYISKEIFSSFALSLFAFIGILLTLRMLRFASLIVNRGVEFSQIGSVFLAVIPTFLEIALPLSVLLGVMLAIGRLSGDSEVIVMRGSGISIFSLATPIIGFGLVVTLITYLIAFFVTPLSHRHVSKTLLEIARNQSIAGLEAGVFNELGKLTLYTEEIDYSTGQLGHVLVKDSRDSEGEKVISADRGLIRSESNDQRIVITLRDGYIHEKIGDKYSLTEFVTNNVSVSAEELFDPNTQKRGLKTKEMSIGEIDRALLRYSNLYQQRLNLEDDQAIKIPADLFYLQPEDLTERSLRRKIGRLKTERARRAAMPFAPLLLALVALPLGIQVPRTQRTWGAGLAACLAMLVFLIYFAIFSIGVSLSEGGAVPPVIALWLPNLVLLIFGVWTLKKVGSESWHSLPHGFELLIERIAGIKARRTT